MNFAASSWYLQLISLLMVTSIYARSMYNKESQGHLHAGGLVEIDYECWEAASRKLVEMKKLRVADTIMGLWDFMNYLNESTNPKHNALFKGLSQDFWDMYVDCVLSRSHGMGRRQLANPNVSLYLHKPDKELVGGLINVNRKFPDNQQGGVQPRPQVSGIEVSDSSNPGFDS